MQTHDRAILADDAGLGKTAQVLAAADAMPLHRVLVIGPAVAGVAWPDQLKLWSPDRAYLSLDSIAMFGLTLPGVYFVSYDIISRADRASLVRELASCRPWDVVVLDEGQYLKTLGANRTLAVYGALLNPRAHKGIVQNTSRVWILSGTLTPNHAGEAYTHLCALFPERLATVPAFKGRVPSLFDFENEFCVVRDTNFGRQIEGSKNLPALRQALDGIILRRLKRDVLRQLPAIEWLTAPLKIDRLAADRLIQPLLDAWATGDPADPSARTSTGMSEAEVLELLSSSPHFSTVRRELGLLKADPSADWVAARLEAGEPKIIVFAHHRDVLHTLMDALKRYNPVLYDGTTPDKDRARVVRQFQQDPDTRVFVGQLQAAGTAITLSSAKTVFMAEWATTPGLNYQAACRAHRMGQRDGVQVYFGTVPDSLDEKITRTAERRAREIAALFD